MESIRCNIIRVLHGCIFFFMCLQVKAHMHVHTHVFDGSLSIVAEDIYIADVSKNNTISNSLHTKATQSKQSISVYKPQIRFVPSSAQTSAFFAHISCPSGQSLVSVRSTISTHIELHETVLNNGIMQMRFVDSIPCTNDHISLEPKGFHAMFIGLKQELILDSTIDVFLTFSNNETIVVPAKVTRVEQHQHDKHNH